MPRPARTISRIASVNCTCRRIGSMPAGVSSFWKTYDSSFGEYISIVWSARSDGFTNVLRGERVVVRHDDENLVAEQRACGEAPIADRRGHDRDIELARQQRGERAPGGLHFDAHFDARTLLAEVLQHVRQPVVARVALGGHAQKALPVLRERADGRFGAFQLRQIWWWPSRARAGRPASRPSGGSAGGTAVCRADPRYHAADD